MFITNIRHVRRALLVGTAVASLILPGLAVSAAAPGNSLLADPADVPVTIMSASGCTGTAPDATRCIKVTGSGLTINQASTSWARILKLCNTRMHITYFDANGKQYKQHNSALRSGCHASGSYTPGGYPYKAKTGKVCGTVSVNGVKKSGACVSIFA